MKNDALSLSAWASEQNLVLGQRCVGDKSNEITTISELLDRLALQNSIVTVDAMGCHTAIAERILARGGDYLLTDRKSTRLNSSHANISYAVFCLKKKKISTSLLIHKLT